MIFRRKLYDELLNWKENWAGRRALLVQGARRVGKSTLVSEFAKNEYETYVLIDFQRDLRKVRDIFYNDMPELDTFFRNLSLVYGTRMIERRTLVIFDDVQFFPLARQSIKQLAEDGRYDYIETGSLITFSQNAADIMIPSGERTVNMHPMDFEEFLWAKGDSVSADAIRDCFRDEIPLGQTAHRKVLRDFMLYLATGGMPEAVAELLETNDLSRVDETKRGILRLYRETLERLDRGHRLSAARILDNVVPELSAGSGLFRSVSLGKNCRASKTYSSYTAIKDSMIVNVANDCTDPERVSEGTGDCSKQRIYMGDTGLLVSAIHALSGNPTEESVYGRLVAGKPGIEVGTILENAVAQALVSAGHELFFHRFGRHEIDFLLTEGKKLLPIEVRSSSYSSHKSLDEFVIKYPDRVETSCLIYGKDLKREGNVLYIPFYMTMCL